MCYPGGLLVSRSGWLTGVMALGGGQENAWQLVAPAGDRSVHHGRTHTHTRCPDRSGSGSLDIFVGYFCFVA